jgi:hypothetical protein
VHAFSNIKIDSNEFPIQISSVSTINFETEWYYGVGNDRPIAVDVAALTTAQLDANVAVDMFLDSDPDKATDTTQAKYEVMIWLGQYGASTQQIGLDQGSIATQVVNGTTFNLFSGVNGLDQSVMTWVASDAATGHTLFFADIGPLLQGLTGLGGPTVNGKRARTSHHTGIRRILRITLFREWALLTLILDYLGYIAFGSEAYDSATNVTFYNKHLAMDLVTAA